MTILDVAREAKVSKSTVSNYLSGAHPVSSDKCHRIELAIKKLGYIPSQPARLLRQEIGREIAIIFPDFDNPHYVQILKGLESIFRENGFELSVFVSQNHVETEKKIIRQCMEKRVRGIVLVTSLVNNESFFQDISRNYHTAIVFIEREVKNMVTNFACIDCEDILYRLTKHFLDVGQSPIALLCNNESYSDAQDAIRGFNRAHFEKDQAPGEIYPLTTSKENAFLVTVDIVRNHCPKVILTTAQHFAEAVIEALRICGKKDDVIVASLGDDVWCKPSAVENGYLLTQRPAIALGKAAANSLIAQITSPYTDEAQRIILKDHFQFEEQNSSRADVPSREHYNGPLRVIMMETGCSKTVEKLLPSFERMSGIPVQLDTYPLKDYFSTVLKKQHSEHPYDVMMIDMPWIGLFANNGLICDITDLAQAPYFDKSIYLQEAFEALSVYRRKIWGLPLYCMPQTLYYRKDLFEDPQIAKRWNDQTKLRLRPPRTWTEFNSIAAFFTRAQNPYSPTEYGISIPGAYPECLSTEILARMSTCRAKLFDSYGRARFNSPEMLAAYYYLLKALEFCPKDFMKKDREDVIHDFLDGRSAMILTFQSIFPTVSKQLFTDKVGVSMTPGNQPLLGGWSLCLSSQAANKEAAFSFINWACGEKTADTMVILTGQTVIRKILENDEFNYVNPWISQYHHHFNNAEPLYFHYLNKGKIVFNVEIDKILYEVLQLTYSRKMSIEEAFTYGQEQMKKIVMKQNQELTP